MGKHWLPSNFRVEINGMTAGYFHGVDGLDSQTEVVENAHKWNDITLKRGYTSARDPLGLKVNPAAHKINPNPAMHKVNPGAAMHKITPNPAMHKVNPNPAMHKIDPNPAAHKVAPGPAMPMGTAARLVLHGFVPDQRNGHLLRHWTDATAPKVATQKTQIVVLDQSGQPVRRYELVNAWPCKWEGPSADGSRSVELAVSNVIRR